jgi:hypothetical protein
MTWISPHFQDIDFPPDMSLDQKIEVFADRVTGWQLDIAQQCADDIPHSGFAVLHIVCSYFEMIAKFQDGYTKNDKSETYFRKGFYSVFPNLINNSQVLDGFLKKLYKDVRCGLYHAGITGPNIMLSGEFPKGIDFNQANNTIPINPHKLVPNIKKHFQSYVRELRDHQNQQQRNNFETRFGKRGKG